MQPLDSEPAQIQLALVSFDSLGDSLIYVMMAENLRLNGFNVTLYGNVAHQLRNWFPQLRTQPLPAMDHLEDALAAYTFVVMSPPAALRANLHSEACKRARGKWALICQKTPEEWVHDHTPRLTAQLSADQMAALRGLPACAGSIRFRDFTTESVVDITLAYMQERMRLPTVVRQVSLTPPAELEFQRYPQRVIVSPDSAGPEKKEWGAHRFLQLCRKLKLRGYEPHLVVAPRNHEHWQTLAHGEFPVPVFPDLNQLASFIYESGALIANDSGNGHLASFLGVRTVTIYRKRNAHFHWRPDWRPAHVITPLLHIPLGGAKTLWRPFIRTSQILQALER